MAIGGSVLGLIILILDVWAIFTILSGGDPPVAKLLWILLILLLPLIGLIIWLIAGRQTHALIR